MIRYAAVIFLSAFLLFQVQPLFGKYILPWFGGTPAVWTTCMLFFQVLLLGGYGYAHFSISRLTPRQQGLVHLVLLAATLIFLPIIPSDAWKPTGEESPTLRILGVLAFTIGAPYLVLSATAPLMQAWFSREFPGRSPYRLYALSNFGSLLGLLSYPFLFEPMLTLHAQGYWWSGVFVVFIIACGWCAWRVRQHSAEFTAATAEMKAEQADLAPSFFDRGLWLALSACGSVMLLATTNQMSQDVASVPFLWVLPLALYLISFIITFDSPRWYWRPVWAVLLPLAVIGAYMAVAIGTSLWLPAQIFAYCFALLACCMVLHGELARIKPAPRYLTGFFLTISAGGALGGFLVSIVAPLTLSRYVEFPIALLLSCALFAVALYRQGMPNPRDLAGVLNVIVLALAFLIGLLLVRGYGDRLEAYNQSVRADRTDWVQKMEFDQLNKLIDDFSASLPQWMQFRWEYRDFNDLAFDILDESWQLRLLLVMALVLAGLLWMSRRPGLEWAKVTAAAVVTLIAGAVTYALLAETTSAQTIAQRRNFYGVLRVDESLNSSGEPGDRTLMHGRITHGIQDLGDNLRRAPTTYYSSDSGVGVAVRAMRDMRGAGGSLNIGVVGLGTGTLAAWGRAGDHIRFYEINQHAIDLSEEYFTYRKDSPAKIDIALGDARITMERDREEKKPQAFDVLAVDAFSGDAVPLHLLTREAFANYFFHLKDDGILAVHISNLYLDLGPLVHDLAEEAGYTAVVVENDDDYSQHIYSSTWVLITNSPKVIDHPIIKEAMEPWPERKDTRRVIFTDDYSNLLRILKRD